MRYTYVRSLQGPWLLYDNQEDPFQQRNLMGLPEYEAIQAKLESSLKVELERCRDEFLPGPEYIKRWGYKTDENGTVPYQP